MDSCDYSPLSGPNKNMKQSLTAFLYKYGNLRVLMVMIISLCICGMFVLSFYLNAVPAPKKIEIDKFAEIQKRLKELVKQDKGKGCAMPFLDPYSQEIAKCEKKVEAVVCNATGDDWVECHFSECYVTNATLAVMEDVECTFKDIVYVSDDLYYLGDPVRVAGGGTYRLQLSDYVRVSCSGHRRDAGALALLKTRWAGYCAGYRPLQPPPAPAEPESLNIFMLFFDSVSRFKFMRRMPLSYEMLTNELSAVVLNSYNIVGMRTAGALFPILSGHNDFEMLDASRTSSNEYVDQHPFIFTLLKSYGYRTAFFEDMPHVGTFSFFYNGFRSMPTDHYARALFQESDWYHGLVWIGANWRYCFGSKSHFRYFADYSADLFKMSGKKFVFTFNTVYSHDFDVLPLVDEELAQFLDKFKKAGHLEDTLLFVMGDHGARFTAERETYQGKIEELLPFVSIVLPERLKKSRPDALTNLLANAQVLTTPFDIHSTILDALDLRVHRVTYKVPGADLERGLSLLEPIPAGRSCAEAGVLPGWCACTPWHMLTREDFTYSRVASELARFVNLATESLRDKCAERHLLSISWVQAQNTSSTTTAYYQARVVMDPGEAVYEGYVQHSLEEDAFLIRDWDVARTNSYGKEPHCISGTHLALSKYCYCIDLKQ